MRSTKFYQIFSELSITDINRFEKFIHSPYFNVNLAIHQLTEIFKNLVKDPSLDTDKIEAWKSIYGSEEYRDQKFRKLLSDLLKLLQHFFVIEELEEKRILKAQLLMQAGNKRKIKKLKSTVMNEAELALKWNANKSSDLYLFKYQIEKNLFYLNEGDSDTHSKQNIESISRNLDTFYISEKLKYYCDVLGREYLGNISYKFEFIDEIIEQVRGHDYQDDMIVQIYFLVSQLLTKPEIAENYYSLKKLVLNNYLSFEGVEQQELFGALLNYCIRQINLGNLDFQQEMVEIYDFIFNRNIILNENYITPAKFKNVITTSLRSGNYDFAEIFIEEYSHLIPASQRKDIVSFSLAQIYFYRKNFTKVIERLQEVDYPDIITNFRSRVLLLATYFELGQIDAFLSLAESIRVFIGRSRKKVTKSILDPYLNLINISKKIILMQHGDEKVGTKILKEIDNNSKNIISEQWLRDKLAERMKS